MGNAGFLGALAAGLLAGCSPFGGASVFNCESDSQCTPGRCLMPERLCVFPDEANCGPGGESYGEHSGKPGVCVGGMNTPDAPPIDAPTMCVANQKYCFENAIETCAADGMGFNPAMKDQCAIECKEIASVPTCVGAASNIMLTDQKACNAMGNALALAPPSGTVTINDTDITCNPSCGTVTTIPRTASAPNNFFCLASITIPAGVTVTYGAGATATTLFSHGNVLIDGTIDFDGKDATGVFDANDANDLPGVGGPGGFIGAAVANAADGPGQIGAGPSGTPLCGGRGGAVAGTGGNAAGGGGGGAGNAGIGGDGGAGRDSANATAAGGGNGINTGCSVAEARPLVGGSGGGGGADGGCQQNFECGWPGGGGGGALHIVSRTQIGGAGTIGASGGNGFGEAAGNGGIGGGGGGGAGGMILLEAPTLAFTGPLRVEGGNGGPSLAGNGGAGATAGNINGTDGTGANQASRGGAGAGGGGGRIRINATTGASCGTASPNVTACTTGTLRTAP